MGQDRPGTRARQVRHAVATLAVLMFLFSPAVSRGQESSAGSAGGRSMLGNPLGAANFPQYDTPSNAPLSGRAGPGGTHVPSAAFSLPGVPNFREILAPGGVQPVQPIEVPAYGNLELPAGELVYGPKDGLTLDAAIDRLIQLNLDIQALRLEIPMAEADVLTANLRANPVLYADTQLIPYGHYSFLRPGGPAQSDVNVNYPLDVTFKRRARRESARSALKVSEAQLQDAIRLQIDNLYTVYVDVIAAGLTLQFSETYAEGLRRLLKLNEQLLLGKQIKPSDVQAIKATLDKALLQIRESKQAKITANQNLALMLNLPLTDLQLEKLDVYDKVGILDPLKESKETLVQKALMTRPDLAAIRLGIARAEADVKLARANRYSDVYLLYQPYTFQNNTYLGVPSASSWTLGVTANIPLYNRNQGNIQRAKINVTQTQVQAASQERTVISDVLTAVREHNQSLASVIQLKNVILPASAEVRDAALRRWQGGETSALEFLDAPPAYNDVVKLYRDAVVRSRRADLDLNTAVAERILP